MSYCLQIFEEVSDFAMDRFHACQPKIHHDYFFEEPKSDQ